MTQLSSSTCLPLSELARRVKCSLPVLLYELTILEKSGLIELKSSTVCITSDGLDVLRRIRSADQNLTEQENNLVSKIIDIVTLRGFSILIKLFHKITVPLLMISMILSLSLLLLENGSLIGIIPVISKYSLFSTSISLMSIFIVMIFVVYYATGKISLGDIILSYTSLNAFSLASIPLCKLVYDAFNVNMYSILLSEITRLILPVLATAITSNIISYSSGKTFERIFLLISTLVLIPSLVVYGLVLQLRVALP